MARPERFIGPLPATGPWSRLDLTRGGFAATLVVAVLAFTFIDGPVWRHLDDSHVRRVLLSYALIPGVLAFLMRERLAERLGKLFAATILIGLMKLVVTAVMLAMFEMTR